MPGMRAREPPTEYVCVCVCAYMLLCARQSAWCRHSQRAVSFRYALAQYNCVNRYIHTRSYTHIWLRRACVQICPHDAIFRIHICAVQAHIHIHTHTHMLLKDTHAENGFCCSLCEHAQGAFSSERCVCVLFET